MYLKRENSATVFSHIPLYELMGWMEFQQQPVLVVNDQLEVIGVLHEKVFWRNIVKDRKMTVAQCANTCFSLLKNENEIHLNDSDEFDFYIIQDGDFYTCYSRLEWYQMLDRKKIDTLLRVNESLKFELEKAMKKNQELIQILNSSYDEIFVTDAEGKVLFVSESCKHFTGMPPEAFIDKSIYELVENGIIEDSVTIKTMKTLTVQSVECTYPNGKTVISTAKPVFDETGKLYRIVTNSRDISELVEVKRLLAKAKNSQKKEETPKVYKAEKFLTQSPNMISILQLAEKIAPLDSSILIQGESGVGKGVLARFIHEHSSRRNKPFIQVNCGAIPASLIESELFGYEGGAFTGASKKGKIGLVEMADGGTLFLDEIGELPLELQVKILHLVQDKTFKKVGGTLEKKVNIRIISATNKNLLHMVEEKTFRQDLYYRLHVVPIRIPPLRERNQDILLLVDHFLKIFNEKYKQQVQIDDKAKLLLQLQEWKGNVRELENFIEQIVVTSTESLIGIDELLHYLNYTKSHLETNLNSFEQITLKKAVEETEKKILSYALDRYKTTRKMAKALGVNQTTIMRKLRKYDLKAINF